MTYRSNAGSPGGGRQCTRGYDNQDHSFRSNATWAADNPGNSGFCDGVLLNSQVNWLAERGEIYTAPFVGAPGTLCVGGGWVYNTRGEDVLDWRKTENPWTDLCGSRGGYVTQDLWHASTSRDGGFWYTGSIRPATGHPYPS